MKTVISGPVTADVIDRASLLMGIVPTSFVTNGRSTPPIGLDLEVEVYPVCKMLGLDLGVIARDWTLANNADAAIIVGGNDHLADCLRKYGLPVYEE